MTQVSAARMQPLQTLMPRLRAAVLVIQSSAVMLWHNSQRTKVCAHAHALALDLHVLDPIIKIQELALFFFFFFFAYLCAHVAPETLVQVSSFRSVERKGWKRIRMYAHNASVMGWSVFRMSFKHRVTDWLWIQMNRNSKHSRLLNGMNERLRTSLGKRAWRDGWKATQLILYHDCLTTVPLSKLKRHKRKCV